MTVVVAGDPLADLRATAADCDDSEAAAVAGMPWLYIGSLAAASDGNWLERRHITRVLTVAPRLDVRVPNSVEHREIKVDDHPSANLLAVFPEAFDVIDAASMAKGGEALLVHCASGVSRSVGTVVGWLISRRKLSLEAALALARTARPRGNPNVGFAVQLQLLEREGGDVNAAIKGWSATASEHALSRARERRTAANEAHAAVDALEEELQRARAEVATAEDAAAARAALTTVRRKLHVLSAQLDEARAGDGLPEDRVAATVWKAARAKLERLIDLE